MKLLILGHGRHGKDTAAEILRDEHGLSFLSSSYACAEVIFPVLELVNGHGDTESAFEHRHSHRELWKRLISLYNAADPAALSKLILSKCDMYVGMRSQREFDASWKHYDAILWIDASERISERDPTMEIEYDPSTMIWVPNNDTLEDFRRNLKWGMQIVLGTFDWR